MRNKRGAGYTGVSSLLKEPQKCRSYLGAAFRRVALPGTGVTRYAVRSFRRHYLPSLHLITQTIPLPAVRRPKELEFGLCRSYWQIDYTNTLARRKAAHWCKADSRRRHCRRVGRLIRGRLRHRLTSAGGVGNYTQPTHTSATSYRSNREKEPAPYGTSSQRVVYASCQMLMRRAKEPYYRPAPTSSRRFKRRRSVLSSST